ncbi:MAG: acetylglutamate kinase [Dehalococcoidales bacterium]|jgi:acetylglutamate kinase|nr:acetylglutamate kinase [Dehalococcoidales bacterium]MDP6737827.1 acetylglutamate kinase [Dehalococcoidales bacterium]
MEKANIIKVGGSTLGRHDTTIEDIVTLQQQGKRLVVVHGGAKIVTNWLARQNIASQFVRGERVTDEASLDVIIAVLAGLINKDIVADISGRGGRAIGLSGVDGTLIKGKIREPEMGYVGTVTRVDTVLLETLLRTGFVPVVAPVSFNSNFTKIHQQTNTSKILNINADIVAGEIAAAIETERLIFLTDVTGILDREGELLPQLLYGEAKALVTSGVASGGMIPKINACLKALSNTSTTSIIDGRQPHALLRELKGQGGGTTIKALFGE